jgi:uncharacterized protein YkwD
VTKKIAIILLLGLVLGFKSDSDRFTSESIDTDRLEQLILQRLNKERTNIGLSRLSSNDTLKDAAADQARYISNLGKLSHHQPKKTKAKTRDRVEFYGGKMQGIGENTAFIKIFEPALYKGKTGAIDTATISSYNRAADYLVYAWMNSTAHKTNILYPKYTETGLKVIYNPELKTLFSVQVFAYPYP